MVRTMTIMAAGKGLLMAFVVAAITESFIDTLVISVLSASITGVFLIINTVIQHKLTSEAAAKIEVRQDTILRRMEEIHQEST